MKQLVLDYHFVHEKMANGQLKVIHVNIENQIADLLTKPLYATRFNELKDKMNVFNGYILLRGHNKGIRQGSTASQS